jgi:Wzt C-terminal domain
MTIRIFYEGAVPGERAHFAVDVHREDGICCYGINTRIDRCDLGPLGSDGYVDLRLSRLALLRGSYVLSIGILDEGAARPRDVHFRAYPFSIASDRHDLGVVPLDHSWSHRRSNGLAPLAAELGEETGS